MRPVTTGLHRLCLDRWKSLRGARLGLLANQASLGQDLIHAKTALSRRLPGALKALFGPQHGYGGEEQDNMQETPHAIDRELQIPVFSLYSETRRPLPHMLEMIDVLIVDLQDVGTRVYTFPATLRGCIEAAAEAGVKVLVLDRPNPLGGEVVEGNLLHPRWHSFVGPFTLPMRHGLTMGEMALMFSRELRIDCDLEVVAMEGWRRAMLWQDTGLRWLMPSPNMPLPETALVYPGQVIWEGTNVSEGRGTCRPFEIFGAPFLDPQILLAALEPEAHRGIHLQSYTFRPTFNKWAGRICRGFMFHVKDPGAFRPYRTTLCLLRAVIRTHPEAFSWRPPPYEYESDRRPIDLILGDPSIREALESGVSVMELESGWKQDLKTYMERRRPYLLYE
ncbi:MAG: DUF1343 domain-containing protein [Deltaproteobacteria bacterium]|nr:MAG: DUF1343 domain-containing protein [Deltaproteobacteria bacterium]